MAPSLLVSGLLAASIVSIANGQACSSRPAGTCSGSCAWNGATCYDVSIHANCQGRTQSQCSGSCAWNGNACRSSTGGSCSGRQQSQCSGGCAWNGHSCLTSTSGSACSGRAQSQCGGGCAWNGNSCYTSSCHGRHQSQCSGGSGCAWSGNTCTASSQTCSGRHQSHCAGDCAWNGNSCGQVCFQSNTAYTPDMPGQGVRTVGNQEACRDHCRNVAGCAHFTFYSNNGRCHLQGHNGARTTASSTYAVGGVPNCGSNTDVHRRRRAAGQLESMPGNVHGANVIGGANTHNQFNGLFSVSLPSLLSSVSGVSWGALAAGACAFLAAIAVAKWRRSSAGRVADAAE